MKILKFYESVKNWKVQDIINNIKDTTFLNEIFTKYIEFKNNLTDNDDVYVKEYFFNKTYGFIINYGTSVDFEVSFHVEDMDELIGFMNNPDLYIDKQKYNL